MSRADDLLTNILNNETPSGEPSSRIEALLYSILGQEVDLSGVPQSRMEELLAAIAENPPGGGLEDDEVAAKYVTLDITVGYFSDTHGGNIQMYGTYDEASKAVLPSSMSVYTGMEHTYTKKVIKGFPPTFSIGFLIQYWGNDQWNDFANDAFYSFTNGLYTCFMGKLIATRYGYGKFKDGSKIRILFPAVQA